MECRLTFFRLYFIGWLPENLFILIFFSLDESKEELMNMNIALDGQGSTVSALDVAHRALSESERVYERVLETTTKITLELRAKVKELQSFSPDELGNIPRKCKL